MLTTLGMLKYDHNIDHALVCGLTNEDTSKLVMFAIHGKHRLNRVSDNGQVRIYDELGRLVLAHIA